MEPTLMHSRRRAETEPDMRTRFKALAIVNNLEQIGMHRLITPFNGKPVLITESGSLLRGVAKKKEGVNGAITPAKVGDASGATFEREEYLELDIHVRRWNFMARKGLNKLEPKFGILNLSVAFIVEGREDTEVGDDFRVRMNLGRSCLVTLARETRARLQPALCFRVTVCWWCLW